GLASGVVRLQLRRRRRATTRPSPSTSPNQPLAAVPPPTAQLQPASPPPRWPTFVTTAEQRGFPLGASLGMQVPRPSVVTAPVQQLLGQLMVAQGSGSQMSLVSVEVLAAVETQASPAGHCVEMQRFVSQATVVGLQNCPGGQYMPPQGSGRQLPLTQ